MVEKLSHLPDAVTRNPEMLAAARRTHAVTVRTMRLALQTDFHESWP